MKTIKAKVYRLPTEESYIYYNSLRNELINTFDWGDEDMFNFDWNDDYIPQHLYITTDKEIKEGDWCYQTVINKVIQARTDYYKDFRFRKIIATNDPKLNSNQIEPYDTSKPYGIEFPQIPQDFIKAYCEQGGIDEVLVECYEEASCKKCNQPVEICDNSPRCEGDYVVINTTKLNPDNTIIIHPVEEKMYSREEVIKLCEDAFDEGSFRDMDFDKWIEENL